MKHKENVFFMLCCAIIAGACLGGAAGMHTVKGEHYLHYTMYRLAALVMRDHITWWIVACIGLFCGGYTAARLLAWILRLPGRAQAAVYKKRAECAGCLGAVAAALVLIQRSVPESERLLWYCAALCFAVCGLWLAAAPVSRRLISILQKATCGALAVLMLLYLGCAALGRLSPPAGPNIVLVVIDCLRPDHLGCYGYARDTSPALDELAGRGVLFTRAYANAPWTKPSVAGLFTSLHPNAHNVCSGYAIMPAGVLTLAEMLKNSGYRTWFFNGGNEFIEQPYNFSQGFDEYIFRPREVCTAADLTADFIERLHAAGHKKFFAYLHYMDTHAPYTANEDNFRYTSLRAPDFAPGDKNGRFKYIRLLTHTGRLQDDTRAYLQALYDGQIRFVDRSIRRIIDELQAVHLLQDTLIIITSDHGEEFWDHRNFEHGHSLYNELLQVPLIISGPGTLGRTVPEIVRLIDLPPTILELAGVEAPPAAGLEGISLAPALKGAQPLPALPVLATGVLYGPEKWCIIAGDQKLILNTDAKEGKWNLIGYRQPGTWEYYDLAGDPGEHRNRASSADTAALQEKLGQFKSRQPLWAAAQLQGALDEDIRRKLEALGYVQ